LTGELLAESSQTTTNSNDESSQDTSSGMGEFCAINFSFVMRKLPTE